MGIPGPTERKRDYDAPLQHLCDVRRTNLTTRLPGARVVRFQDITGVTLEGMDLVIITYNLKGDTPAGKIDMVSRTVVLQKCNVRRQKDSCRITHTSPFSPPPLRVLVRSSEATKI
jgi:hypothetical protein